MDALDRIAQHIIYRHDDAGWNEADHPRDADGKFTEGSGGGKKSGIPKIAASQGKPYEHIHAAATDPKTSDSEKLEKVSKLIADFQNKYKGGYLKSISAYANNVQTYIETGEWKGKKPKEEPAPDAEKPESKPAPEEKKSGYKPPAFEPKNTKILAKATENYQKKAEAEVNKTIELESEGHPLSSEALNSAQAYHTILDILNNNDDAKVIQGKLSKVTGTIGYVKQFLHYAKEDVADSILLAELKDKHPPISHSDLTPYAQQLGSEVMKSLGHMTNAHNKEIVMQGMEKVTSILSLGTFEEQKEALEKFPIKDVPDSQGVTNFNKYLAEIKAGFGITAPPKNSMQQLKETIKPSANIIEPKIKNKTYQKYDALFKTAHDLGAVASGHIIPSAAPGAWSKVPQKIRSAVKTYTGSDYSWINSTLRKNEGVPSESQLETIHAIDDAFADEDFSHLKDDVKLFRGEKMPEDQLNELKKALKNTGIARYSKAGFISTSTVKGSYASSKNVQFEIVARKNTGALYAKAISSHQNENEVMLRHGQNFEILSIEEKAGQHIIRMVTI